MQKAHVPGDPRGGEGPLLVQIPEKANGRRAALIPERANKSGPSHTSKGEQLAGPSSALIRRRARCQLLHLAPSKKM